MGQAPKNEPAPNDRVRIALYRCRHLFVNGRSPGIISLSDSDWDADDMATPTAPAPAAVELSDGERRFVEEYMIDLCYSASYRRAFPMTSYHTAKTLGPAMARREHVRAAIRAEMRDRSIRTRVSADLVLRELVRIA